VIACFVAKNITTQQFFLALILLLSHDREDDLILYFNKEIGVGGR